MHGTMNIKFILLSNCGMIHVYFTIMTDYCTICGIFSQLLQLSEDGYVSVAETCRRKKLTTVQLVGNKHVCDKGVSSLHQRSYRCERKTLND